MAVGSLHIVTQKGAKIGRWAINRISQRLRGEVKSTEGERKDRTIRRLS